MKTILLTIIIFFTTFSLFPQTPVFHPLASYNPQHPTETDIDSISTLLANKTVIGLGEATHGTSEFMKVRHRLANYLIKHQGFNTIILEANYSACIPINDYIHGKTDSLPTAIKSIGLWPFTTGEMAAFAKDLRLYNQSNPGHMVQFMGCNMQLAHRDLTALLSYITDSTVYKQLAKYSKNNKEINSHREKILPIIYKIKAKNPQNINIQMLCNGLIQFTTIDYLDRSSDAKTLKTNYYRDSCMAANIKSYLQLTPKSKGIYIAHNEHISYWNDTKNDYADSGYYLKQHFGDNYMAIATECKEGLFNAYAFSKKGEPIGLQPCSFRKDKTMFLGNYLSKLGPDLLFIEKSELPKKIKRMHSIGSVHYYKQRYTQGNLKWYDAFIYIKQSTPTQLFPDYLKQEQKTIK